MQIAFDDIRSHLRRLRGRRGSVAVFFAACIVGLSGLAAVATQQRVQPASATAPPSVEEVLRTVRADLQASRSDIIAKNVSLTSEQAAKFWPVFETYQKEQNAIMDEQMKGIQQYVDGFDTLDDTASLGLMKAHFTRDQKMVELRQKWLAEFQKVLPTKLAVRVMQIDRRLSLVHQVEFASHIPLSY
jgi:Spy/CpxP family protein refolding chaperone